VNDIYSAILSAFRLIATLDADLVEIVVRSLEINLSAVAIAAAIGLPLGGVLAMHRFPGRHALVVIVNALMGLPPVVVGLVVYLVLSRSGPLGVFGLLFTPTAMVVAQVVLVAPIVTALSRQVVEDLWQEYEEQLRSLGANAGRALPTILWEGRFALITVVLAGLGRASAEVGAVMIVGGNIDHLTRVMTTTIALETSKGNLALALGLGIILIAISVMINASAFLTTETARTAR
jgi:tungstate transport system permease protein